jgi:hypothetical protein
MVNEKGKVEEIPNTSQERKGKKMEKTNGNQRII